MLHHRARLCTAPQDDGPGPFPGDHTVNALRLASGSLTRKKILEAAGVPLDVVQPRVDEDAARAAFEADALRPREIADALAELKARRVGEAHPDGLTLGADQVLEFEGRAIGKCETQDEARELLARLSGQQHVLWSAAVIYEDARAVWRHIGQARMKMRPLSAAFIDDYVDRNWADIRHSVGCYQVEAEGIRLFETIGADYHAIQGLPLLPLLQFLTLRGVLQA
jgi:septum formation protein